MLARIALAVVLSAACSAPSLAADPKAYDPAATLAAQREARLAKLDGTWRGSATMKLPGRKTREVTQTERVGSFLLDGTVKLTRRAG